MKVGIISFFDYDLYIRPKKKLKIYENWNKAWEEVLNLSKKNNIHLFKYDFKKHEQYEKIIFVEIPRITELFRVIFLNLFRKRIHTILIVNETFLGRARYMLRVPFLFNRVLINCEKKLNNFMSYKVNTFSYPSLPSKDIIKSQKKLILNPNRKNKLVFIGSFKMALSKHGSYKYRYKLIKKFIKYPSFFDLYGFGWDKVPLPFDIIGIAIITRVKFLNSLVKNMMNFYFKPLGKFRIANSKAKTLQKYDFALAVEPTVSKFNSICEKIFDPMLSGSIPVYYGQEFVKNIPEDTFIRINKNEPVEKIVNKLENLTEEEKYNYRKNIYKFLNSKIADRYRYSNYANLLVNAILKKN